MQELNLSQATLVDLEAKGITLEYNEASPYSTKYFLRYPNGLANPVYNDWVSVQNDYKSGVLNKGSGNWTQDGATFDVNITQPFPDESGMWIDYWNTSYDSQGNLIDPVTITTVLMWIAIIIIGIATCIISYGVLMNHACGWGVDVQQINDCEKIVTKPNCDTASFNICANNGQGAWTNWFDTGFDWMLIVWIGAGLVGLYIAAKVLPDLFKGGHGDDDTGEILKLQKAKLMRELSK